MSTPRDKPLELSLEPMEPPPAKPEAAEGTTITIGEAPTRPAGPRPPASRPADAPPKEATAPADRFVALATRELQDGNLDQRLWARVLLVSGDDQSQARTAYIRARATVLRLAARDQRVPDEPAAGAVASNAAPAPAGAAGRTRHRVHGGRPQAVRIAIAVGVLGVVGALAWMTLGSSDEPTTLRTAAAPVAAASIASVPTRADEIAAQERIAAAAVAAELEARVKSLRDARNWNVMVLNAAEWTRKQPDNATAWSLLATGYANLGQLPDAREAADAAVKRAPDDPRMWRDLGALDVALNEPARALSSYTRATALDAQDYDSFVQAGTLETQLERYAEARVDFDRALVLRADDEVALCGLANVSKLQGRAAEADALQKRVKAAGHACTGGMTVGLRTATAAGTETVRPGAPPTR